MKSHRILNEAVADLETIMEDLREQYDLPESDIESKRGMKAKNATKDDGVETKRGMSHESHTQSRRVESKGRML